MIILLEKVVFWKKKKESIEIDGGDKLTNYDNFGRFLKFRKIQWDF